MSTITLSEAALDLLRERITIDRYDVTPDNLEAYRELVAAGIMIPISTFTALSAILLHADSQVSPGFRGIGEFLCTHETPREGH